MYENLRYSTDQLVCFSYSADLKSFFAEVVKTKNLKIESPGSRPRSQSDKPRKNFSPLEQHRRELGEPLSNYLNMTACSVHMFCLELYMRCLCVLTLHCVVLSCITGLRAPTSNRQGEVW